MDFSRYSKARIMQSAVDWDVPRDYFDPIYNYMVYGYEPGSFFSAVLANDFFVQCNQVILATQFLH